MARLIVRPRPKFKKRRSRSSVGTNTLLIPVSPGSITLGGGTPTMGYRPPAGALTLTGKVPVLVQPLNVVVVPKGALTLTGQLPTQTGIVPGVGNVIRANDFDNLLIVTSKVYGTGFGDRGYGQSAITLPSSGFVNAPVTSSMWTNLKSAVVVCQNHQATGGGLPAFTSGTAITASDIDAIQSVVYAIDANRLNASVFSMFITSGAYTNTRATSWGTSASVPTITATFTADLGSENAARFFFNSGGWIRLRFTQTSAAGVQATWNAFFANVGNITFAANSTTVDGNTGTGSAIGFYQLTGSAQQIFTATDASSNTITITAVRRNFSGVNGGNGTGVQFAVSLTSPETGTLAGGTTALVSDYRKPSSVLTGIASPTYATVSGF